ncbi:hypothetical protein [Paenibacillus lemnae]|uniref:STAS/SEC14 domain-containing protein n=1 Tax=Paenibacillus lemnae TaxID=1330551 RepID=A0A848M6H8_PAELE|nr:hypothetical protein [Paenibacillus lemnae]NMO95443.1 hypothetical protein [Paenibacillus lemnae]
MSSTRILDKNYRIIEIVWDQKAKPEDFHRITREIEQLAKQLNGAFDVIVDMRNVKAFMPESQAELVVHQKDVMGFGMQRAAVIVDGAITKMQLKRSAKQAEHHTETHWNSYEEALNFLKSNPLDTYNEVPDYHYSR